MPGWVAGSDVVVDHAGFVVTGAMLRRGGAEARKHRFERVAAFGSPVPSQLTDLLSVLEPEADL